MMLEEYPKNYLYRRVVQAKLFIDNRFAENIEINNIADEACFSKFHFIRLFKQIYGKTPHQYLISVRIEKAIQLLSEGNPVSEVCLSVGFESTSSFSGLFKRFMGISPSIFLIRELNRKQQMAAKPLHYIPGCFSYQHGWTKQSNFGEVEL